MVFGFGGGKSSKDDEPVSEALRQASRAAARLIADNATSLARLPRRQGALLGRHSDPTPLLSERRMPVPRLTPPERMALARAPKRDGRIGGVAVKDVLGDVMNIPNNVIGETYGALGHAAGQLMGGHPRVVRRPGRTEFMNNPFGGVGAITIGNVTTYNDDPYSPEGRSNWSGAEEREGHPVWVHEDQHVQQARQLGPAYLPMNVVGGLSGLLWGRDWHDDHNVMERGPKANPARPWGPEHRR